MKLYELLEGNVQTELDNIEIKGITDDTRKVSEGYIFVCIKGEKFDGHEFAEDMLKKGASAVVADHSLNLGKNEIIVENTRDFYGLLCAKWFGNPERRMKFIGVTGTNGKTTITNVIKKILTDNGHKVGLIGTIQNEIGDKVIHTENTTPFAYDLMKLYAQMADEGCDYVVMEVSSFGLVQKRIGCTHFDTALFTNLTQDHLDYHKTMENYYQAKKMLFSICDRAIINTDDSYGKRLYNEISCEKYSYGVSENTDFSAELLSIKATGTKFVLKNSGKSYNIDMLMTGMFNVMNITGAIAVCVQQGISIESCIESIKNYGGVKGRCEVIPTGKDFAVICDYAHTPDAIENILINVKKCTENRLICLFGCGGNRDSSKRPKMAHSAEKYADYLIVTSDNPRNENPDDIISDILKGLEGTKPYDVVTDRRKAIYHALEIAQKGDVIVLAGKGHEDYQILADNVHIHFDEREVVAEGLKLL